MQFFKMQIIPVAKNESKISCPPSIFFKKNQKIFLYVKQL